MIKILIADDHAIVREGLKQIVAEQPDLSVTGEAADVPELMDLLHADHFDLLILDINMPGKSGLDALKDIKIEYPQLPVLILSMYSEEQFGLRSLKAGADGFLKKVSAPDQLVEAIRQLIKGRKYISQNLAEKMAENLDRRQENQPHEKLSDRDNIVQDARKKAQQIEAEADVRAKKTQADADEYVTETLTNLEIALERVLNQVRNGIYILEEESRFPAEESPHPDEVKEQ